MKLKTQKTNAIVLRTLPVTNTSAIVVWLTRRRGRIATMIKGAYRPKSRFLGQFDLFYTCELVFYTRAREHLHTAREASPLKLRKAFRSDWRGCAMASYIVNLAEKVTPWSAPHPEIYRVVDAELDDLAENGGDLASLFWFEIFLMGMLGFAPRLNSCAVCARNIKENPGGGIFSDSHGGLLCRDCAGDDTSRLMRVSAGSVALLRQWQRAETADRARRLRSSPTQDKEIASLLGRFLRYHLDTPLESRRTAMEWCGLQIKMFLVYICLVYSNLIYSSL